jgi:glutamine cyclotransferase
MIQRTSGSWLLKLFFLAALEVLPRRFLTRPIFLIFSDSETMVKNTPVQQHSILTRSKTLGMIGLITVFGAVILASIFQSTEQPVPIPVSYHRGEIVQGWHGDGECFVQGLTRFNQSHSIATCGGYGSSRVILLSGLESNEIKSTTVFSADKKLFFEGCAIVGNKLVILTWRERVIFELALNAFTVIRRVKYPRDGWGLTYDSDRNVLWATDGSDRLYQLDPNTLETKENRQVRISHDGNQFEPVPYMNELEYMNGTIWANIYMDTSAVKESPNFIIGISPITCIVTKIVPLFGLEPKRSPSSVFNGISTWEDGTLLVTGKNWKNVYQVSVGDVVAPSYDPLWSRFNITSFLRQRYNFR